MALRLPMATLDLPLSEVGKARATAMLLLNFAAQIPAELQGIEAIVLLCLLFDIGVADVKGHHLCPALRCQRKRCRKCCMYMHVQKEKETRGD